MDVSKPAPCRIAVIGAGLVGMRHAQLIADHDDCELAAIVNPSAEVEALAGQLDCPQLSDVHALGSDVDAVIIATPNHTHFSIGMYCAERGLPSLIEKPITDKIDEGQTLVDAFETRDIPLLVGHHRRYHPFVAEAQNLIASGEIGVPVCGSIIWAVKKPDSYFESGAWRLGADGGPIMINFIHEIDLLRCLFGKLAEVTAVSSNRQRLTGVEDTTAIILRFTSGFLATVTLSDAALTPWSFEGASGENPTIADTGVSSWRIGCSDGAFEFPNLRVWKHSGGNGDWSKSLDVNSTGSAKVVPLAAQLTHFVNLVRGVEKTPKVSGVEGLASLRATRAVLQSARSGTAIAMDNFVEDIEPDSVST